MKTALTKTAQYLPYALALGILALTIFVAGCQSSANYRGENLTQPELEVRVQSDLASLEIKAQQIQAEAEKIVAEGQVAAVEIARKDAIKQKVFSVASNAAITLFSGGTINRGEALSQGLGLAGILFGVGGVGSAVVATRSSRRNKTALADVVTAIDKVKDPDGTVKFGDPATKTRLEANMENSSLRTVDKIRNQK